MLVFKSHSIQKDAESSVYVFIGQVNDDMLSPLSHSEMLMD